MIKCTIFFTHTNASMDKIQHKIIAEPLVQYTANIQRCRSRVHMFTFTWMWHTVSVTDAGHVGGAWRGRGYLEGQGLGSLLNSHKNYNHYLDLMVVAA